MNGFVIFFRFLFSNYKRILLIFVLTLVFLILLFPLGDLNDLISSQVSKLTNGQVYFQFDNMHLNPLATSDTAPHLDMRRIFCDPGVPGKRPRLLR